MRKDTVSKHFFEQIYRRYNDPWDFENSAYELDRYARTLSALKGRTYLRAFEPGCSIGVLTAQLAPLCTSLQAMDISEIAVGRARHRCQNLVNVELSCGRLPFDMPPGTFDLIVFSELGYYFDENALMLLGNRLIESLDRNGILLAVHWLGHSEDHILEGDCVHDILRELTGIELDYSEHHEAFRLDRWIRN